MDTGNTRMRHAIWVLEVLPAVNYCQELDWIPIF